MSTYATFSGRWISRWMSWTARSKPYCQFFSEKYHTGMSQCQCGSQYCIMHIWLSKKNFWDHGEHDFATECTIQQPFVGPAGKAQSVPQACKLDLGRGPRDMKWIQWEGRERERRERGRREREWKGGKGDKVPYLYSFFPIVLPAHAIYELLSSRWRTSWVKESAFKQITGCRDVEAKLVDTDCNYWHKAHRHAGPADHVSEVLHPQT